MGMSLYLSQSHVSAYMKKLNDLIKDGNISTNVKFKLMDVVEMRENNWIPVKQRVPPITTLDQVILIISHGI